MYQQSILSVFQLESRKEMCRKQKITNEKEGNNLSRKCVLNVNRILFGINVYVYTSFINTTSIFDTKM